MEKDYIKHNLGIEATKDIEEGMIVGLGTGTTAYWAVKEIAHKISKGLNIYGIPTSNETELLARGLGIPLLDINEVKKIDITIDGADEITSNLEVIKGGGGALLREKLVAEKSEKVIIIGNKSKFVDKLGRFKLPVEICKFNWNGTKSKVEELGCIAALRVKDNSPFISDNGNYILDCDFGLIEDPESLHGALKLITGVFETGLFLNSISQALIGKEDKFVILTKGEPINEKSY